MNSTSNQSIGNREEELGVLQKCLEFQRQEVATYLPKFEELLCTSRIEEDEDDGGADWGDNDDEKTWDRKVHHYVQEVEKSRCLILSLKQRIDAIKNELNPEPVEEQE